MQSTLYPLAIPWGLVLLLLQQNCFFNVCYNRFIPPLYGLQGLCFLSFLLRLHRLPQDSKNKTVPPVESILVNATYKSFRPVLLEPISFVSAVLSMSSIYAGGTSSRHSTAAVFAVGLFFPVLAPPQRFVTRILRDHVPSQEK